MTLATRSLASTSTQAAHLWRSLQKATTQEEIDRILESLLQNQEEQELAIDAYADLADQIDAEIAAISARLKHLTDIHESAIAQLQGWRNRLDKTILSLNERGTFGTEIAGKQRQIAVKDNPPTCEIEIAPQDLPPEYRTVTCELNLDAEELPPELQKKVKKTKYTANKKAITAAWKRGIPVEGTQVYRRRKVTYQLLAGNNLNSFQGDRTQKTTSKKKRQKT